MVNRYGNPPPPIVVCAGCEQLTAERDEAREETKGVRTALENVHSIAAGYEETIKDLQSKLDSYRWIPVSERMPTRGIAVIAYTESGACQAWYDGKEWRDGYTCNGPACYGGMDRVTHWMPMPEDPK